MTRKKASSKDTTIGAYGHEVLALLYRYGGLNRYQLQRLTGLSLAAVGRQTTHLRRAGLVAIARDSAAWQEGHPGGKGNGRPYSVYHLSNPAGAKAGGRAVGVEYDRAAVRDYRRIQMPVTTAHRVLANEYLITLREAALASGLEMPAEEIWSESGTDLPLFGVGRAKAPRKDTSYRYTVIVPDGAFVVDGQRYYLELESGLRTRPVLTKLRDYAGRWRRRLAPNAGEVRWHDPEARLEPVVIVTAHTEHAKSLQRALRERLPEVEGWLEAEAAISEAAGVQIDSRKLILVAGWEEVREDPLGRVYRPARRYPPDASAEDGWRVSLADAAAVAARITPPDTEQVRERLEAEAAEESKEVAS